MEKFLNSKILSVLVISFCATISTAAIVEVMSRQEMLSILDNKVIEFTKEGLETNQSLLTEFTKKQSDIVEIVKIIESKNEEISTRIRDIRKLSARMKTLILGGSIKKSETLERIALEYQVLIKANLDDENNEGEILFYITSNINLVKKFSSTFLIAMLAVMSGVVGSLVTVFRLETYSIDFLKRLVLGITTGFISFLIIKGGRSLFLLEGNDTLPIMNPYSAALFSLIGGMFTEKFFKLLGDLFDSLIEKLTIKKEGNQYTK
ncbi:hypothetical protein [Leptospira bouyouniensis]|uniref:hypothetical protein n=1 Tax=Leptospira bouyouniensis TaxID=2484911 RepID=UPI001090F99F|nr:hypothetical protein [Leptospira bouyouniensis]TGM85075.1 hypothetical protein EHQ99_06380 [Leptospira bouyouniensis]